MTRALFLLFSLPLCLAACSSTHYGDPQAAETVNADWGSTDLQQFSSKMAKSLIDEPKLAFLDSPGKGEDKRIKMYMGGIRNETTEHINLEAVTDSIRVELLESGRFRFMADNKGQDEIGEQVRFQNESGRVNPEEARKFGKQHGAEVVLYGTLYSIEKKKNRSVESGGVKTEDVYYLFIFNCVDIETGEILWTKKDEIRKAEKTGFFGRS